MIDQDHEWVNSKNRLPVGDFVCDVRLTMNSAPFQRSAQWVRIWECWGGFWRPAASEREV